MIPSIPLSLFLRLSLSSSLHFYLTLSRFLPLSLSPPLSLSRSPFLFFLSPFLTVSVRKYHE